MRKQAFFRILIGFTLAVCAASNLSASTTGKISGVVTNVATGDPLVGATVMIEGTPIGTKTDEDGEYFIINVPVGKYRIAISYVGFQRITKEDVRVLADLTTPVDFELEETAVEVPEQVVSATLAPIQKDMTESKMIFTADRIRVMPNASTIQAVLNKYPGVVTDENDALHVRGGRAGQLSYYYDGFSIQDPFVANSGMYIIPSALEELSLTTGGYSAEYGDALSGVVNAVTPEGGSQYHGAFKYYEGATYPYNPGTGQIDALKRVGDRGFSGRLSGPLFTLEPKRYNFFAAAELLKAPTYLPENTTNSFTGTTNFTMQPTGKTKWKGNFSYYHADGDVFIHRDGNGRSYNFNMDGLPGFEKESYLVGINGNYNFNEQLVWMTSLSRFSSATKQAPKSLFDKYWKEWPGYSEDVNGRYNGTIHENNYGNGNAYDPSNPYNLVGFTTGSDFLPAYHEREAAYNAVHTDLIYQVSKTHQFKTGVEYRSYDIAWDVKQFYNTNPYGEKYSSTPLYLASYIQDKMEYANLVINAGVRIDYRNVDVTYNATPGQSNLIYKNSDAKTRISPRLGMSFPISEKTVMHFNYGLYYQAPQFNYVYMNLQGDVSTGFPLVGNPNLEPEETISYELGVDHMIADDLRLDITAYYKDINDLVTTTSPYMSGGNPVTFFENGDYGSARGIDVAIEKLPLKGFFSASIAYSYMIAGGNGSYALEPYYTYITSSEDTLAPVTEYPLDFDQRHTLTAVVEYRVPAGWNRRWMGFKLPDAWGVSMVGYYGSGLPYTPTDQRGNRLGERNEGRLPARYSVDMRMNKTFTLSGSKNRSVDFFVEINNLFNRRNAIDVYSRTGQAYTDGSRPGSGYASNQQELDHLDKIYDNDPQNYSPPRSIRTGVEFKF